MPRFIISLACPDRPGIVHAITGALLAAGGNIIESQQYGSAETGTFFLRVEVETAGGRAALEERLTPVREAFDMRLELHSSAAPLRTLILCSTAEHAVNELLFQRRSGSLPIDVPLVVSNHDALRPLAEFHGVPFERIEVTPQTKPEAEARILELIEEHDIELVVLARYMQILSDDLCRALAGRAINIHHSFLPSFKGARPYHQAHERGVKLIGATAHYVTADLDEGPIIDQDVVRVRHDRTPAQLVERGRTVEAQTLARAVRWHAERRVLLDGHRTVVFD
ncbi:formyltetrahydrofolate deformylase [Galactobacter valiniphilus]|uniref:Formyltetrahydrofolate deformylase n=1 Tax=Galactobacter valiniphilus TaxID=2676122 RepID=A0A399JFH2_9MICC|nr:formyltetrahydrofolate deformylase [Galactobacter valiniphilus]RII42939.1 formyltetrahydrofolate deformylase [Galactobacter valiniphilus]